MKRPLECKGFTLAFSLKAAQSRQVVDRSGTAPPSLGETWGNTPLYILRGLKKEKCNRKFEKNFRRDLTSSLVALFGRSWLAIAHTIKWFQNAGSAPIVLSF